MKQLNAFVIYGFIVITFITCGKKDLQPGYNIIDQDAQELREKKMTSKTSDNATVEVSSSNLIDISQVLTQYPGTLTESQAEAQLEPMQQSGMQIHAELLSQLVGTEDWNALTIEEKDSILNYTDEQFALLSGIYSSTAAGSNIKACLLVALGIREIGEIISGYSGLFNAKTALQILKAVGKRYLGWIGVAVAVYEFSDCIASGNTDQGDGTNGDGCLLPSQFFIRTFFDQNKEDMISFLLNKYPQFGNYTYWDWILETAFIDGCNPEADLNQPEIATYFSRDDE
ncbi:MAG: hypothetical protein J7599_12760 [Niabella sp.]|nr:hypothetical protein [Niabella sp.]